MTDDNERARFDAWWLGEDGPYSIRAERPSSMTEAAWMGWRAQEEENAKLRAALEELIWYTNQLELDVYDPKEWPDEHSAVTQARAALGGDT